MRSSGLDAALLSSPHALRYYTGFTGTNGAAVVRPGRAVFVTDSRYREQAAQEVRTMPFTVAVGSLWEEVSRLGVLKGCVNAGIEEEHTSVATLRLLRRSLRGLRWAPADTVITGPMLHKDPMELAALRRAVRISERVLDEILGLLRPGMREREIGAEISRRHRMHGADGDSFAPIVASGPRSALPHARASSRRVRRGEPILLDFGCVVGGYRSDITRTVAIGHAPPRLRTIHAAVLAAQDAAFAAVRPGAEARAVDAAAREEFRRHGLEKHFVHSLGHGIGLRVHERPLLGMRSRDLLAEDDVITLEPGLYFPGFGGVRIEDDVLVTRGGERRLTTATRDLTVIR